jgi:hypothetical protein
MNGHCQETLSASMILLRGVQLTHVQRYCTEVQLCKWCFHIKFVLFMRPIHVWRSRTPVDFPSDITTIMDQKVQLLKPLN